MDLTKGTMRRYLPVLAAFASLAMLFVPSSAGSSTRRPSPATVFRQPGNAFTVSPSAAAAPAVLTATGTGCTGANPIVQVWLSLVPEGSSDEFDVFGTTRGQGGSIDGSGTWSVPVTLTQLVPEGSYVIDARCLGDAADSSSGAFFYTAQPFAVLPGPVASWSASPLTAASDTEVSVTVRGTGCRGAHAKVSIWVTGATERDYDNGYGGATASPDQTGDWEAEVSLAARPPTTYAFQANCSTTLQSFIYRPAPLYVRTVPQLTSGGELTFTG